MNMTAQKSIEEKIINIRISTLWYLSGCLVIAMVSAFSFYTGIMDSQAKIYAKLDTMDRRQEIKGLMQSNLNRGFEDSEKQHELRLLRLESIIK